MSVASDIIRTYRAPRSVMRDRLATNASEANSLATLMAACLLIFAAQGPRLSRQAFLDNEVPLEALLTATLFGWIFVAPLCFYVVALIVFWFMKAIGADAEAGEVRFVLFWGLLAATPAILLNGLVAGFLGSGVALSLTGAFALAALLVFWGSGLLEVARQGVMS